MMQPVSYAIIQGQQYVYSSLDISADPEKKWRNAWTVDAGNVVSIDWTLAREQFRETAAIERSDFFMNTTAAGHMTKEDAVLAASGTWPATFDPALNGMTPDEQAAAKVAFTHTVYRRNHELIELLRNYMGLTPEQVDALFGYDGQ